MKIRTAQWIAHPMLKVQVQLKSSRTFPRILGFQKQEKLCAEERVDAKEVSCKLEAALWPNEWLEKKYQSRRRNVKT